MRSLINWWSKNHIAANFLMWGLIALGLLSWFGQRKEIFPEVTTNIITVSVPYPNAAPEEVEKGVCIPVEEAVQGLDGIKRLTSRSNESVGVVIIEVKEEFDEQEVANRVKARVDGIRNFAESAEKPVIEVIPIKSQIMSVTVSAAGTDDKNLRAVAEQVRDAIEALPDVTQVELSGIKRHEVSIEVSEDTLRRHGLTFDQVAAAVRSSSLDLPGGSLRTKAGEILIRTQARKYSAAEFEEITVLTRPDGSRLLIKDIASVIDGFQEVDLFTRFDGRPAIVVNIYRTGDEDTLKVAAAVKKWLETAPQQFPEGVRLEVWNDVSLLLEGRLNLMLQDAWQGFCLVYLMLSLFLRPALAFHVALGIPIAFAGGLIFLPLVDISVNMISLFAFIVVLGIVTDDAIVVGENVHARMSTGEPSKLAAPRGAYEVMVVAIFGVFTVVVAFMPMLFVSGVGGKIWRNIPWVVIPTLLVSLIETNLILPAHLSHLKPEKPLDQINPFVRFIVRVQRAMSRHVESFIQNRYRPFINLALRWRYATVTAFIAVFLGVIGLIMGSWIPFEFFPRVEAEIISAKLTLPAGVAVETTQQAIDRIEAAANRLNDHFKGLDGEPVVKHMLSAVGAQPFKVGMTPGGASDSSNIGEVTVELIAASARSIKSQDIVAKWRELTGPIPGTVELSFLENTSRTGAAIELLLHGRDLDRLNQATALVKENLAAIRGVTDITDTNRDGKRELKLNILPEAENLGIRLADVARQTRQAFYGEEVQRLQRGRDEVKVMVRYPRDERRSLEDIASLRIRTPQGAELPFSSVAAPVEGRGFSSIYRSDRERGVIISAELDKNVPDVDANMVVAALVRPDTGDGGGILTRLQRDFPDVRWSFEGEQKNQRDNLKDIAIGGLLALFGIYVLLAIPLRSYVQPFIVMSVIPFGMTGAVIGHLVMGVELSIMSMIGIVALSGVVVNESLVLVEYVNRHRRGGESITGAAREGGAARFQAIMLTSITSFIGVMPIVAESSIQAKFLIPCAISLAFGCLSNLLNTLILVPCVYAILEDIKRLLFTREQRLHWEETEREEARERGLEWMDGGNPAPASVDH